MTNIIYQVNKSNFYNTSDWSDAHAEHIGWFTSPYFFFKFTLLGWYKVISKIYQKAFIEAWPVPCDLYRHFES